MSLKDTDNKKLADHIKRHLFKCRDIGPEPEFNKTPFWKDLHKESTAKKLKDLINEHKNQQAK